MLYYRLAYTLHSFSGEPRNIEISYFENSPQNCENVCEYKTYHVCVTAACLHINSK